MSASPGDTSSYFKLGLFMLIGVAMLAAGVISLGAASLFQKKIPAETLVYDSVNGLEVGSVVKYRGVPIGQVTQILFASAKYTEANTVTISQMHSGHDVRGVLIEMAITQQAFPGRSEKQIRELAWQLVGQGLRASVTPAGISGQSYIELDILDATQFPLPPINWKPDVLYIPSAPSPINQVLDAAGQIATQLQQANLGRVVHHFDDLATQANLAVANVNRILDANRENVYRTLAELPDTAAHLRATTARADQLLHDPRVNKVIDELPELGDSAKGTFVDARRVIREADELLAGESNDIRATLTSLRRLAADGAALIDDARQNPSRVFFGKPPSVDSQTLAH